MEKNKINFVFERTEKKYSMKEAQWEELKKRIEPYIKQDQYGQHTICNIYYDTDSYELIRNSIESPIYKEKLRLRSYGIPKENSMVFLEIKKKYEGIVYKRRISILLSEAETYLKTGKKPKGEYNKQIFSEIDYFVQFYHPKPTVFLAYDRVAFTAKDNSDIRLTIDKNIRSRESNINLTYGDEGNLLLTEKERLLEIKVPCAMPLWLANALSELQIYPASFSKYGTVYRNQLVKNLQKKMQYISYPSIKENENYTGLKGILQAASR